MRMILEDLVTRYGVEDYEIMLKVKENLGNVTSQTPVTQTKLICAELVDILDQSFGVQPVQENLYENPDFHAMAIENQDLKHQIDFLKTENQTAQSTIAEQKKEYNALQTQVVQLQENKDSINTLLLRTTQQKAESWQNKYEQLKSSYDDNIEQKVQRIKALEDRNAQLTLKIEELQAIEKKVARAEVSALEAQKAENEARNKMYAIEDKLNASNSECEHLRDVIQTKDEQLNTMLGNIDLISSEVEHFKSVLRKCTSDMNVSYVHEKSDDNIEIKEPKVFNSNIVKPMSSVEPVPKQKNESISNSNTQSPTISSASVADMGTVTPFNPNNSVGADDFPDYNGNNKGTEQQDLLSQFGQGESKSTSIMGWMKNKFTMLF